MKKSGGDEMQGGGICSKEFVDFMHAVSGSFSSEQRLWEAITAAIPPLVEKLHIGYLTVRMETQKSVLVPDGDTIQEVIYGRIEECSTFSEKNMRFDMDGNSVFWVTACPVPEHVWDAKEHDAVQLLGEDLFLLCSRILMRHMLENAASLDYLTGALNKHGMLRHGGTLRQEGKLSGYVGIYLNLKNFKYINQSIGYRKADVLLTAYSRALRDRLTGEERVCRPGGDTFFVLTERAHADAMLDYLNEVQLEVSTDNGSRSFSLYAHVGIYDINEEDDISTVMNSASIAMQAARQSGQAADQMWFDPVMHARAMHEKQISQLFPSALKNGEFLVYYQPKVTLEDRTLSGSEALVRWFHKGRIVPPMEFIPVLEKDGTVCRLDFYVLEQVCKDLRGWLDAGIDPVRVSVNFSQQHLHDTRLADEIIAVLERYQVDSRYIEVELTEMSGARDHEAMLAFLKSMHEHGICTSIDDFGTGYSSLNMLREFNMDVIKLDKSFLDKLTEEGEDHRADEVVIENIFRMAQALDLEIVSEGVETRSQAEFLRRIHCDMVQGYLFDKPLPHDEYEKRLRGSRVYELPESAGS